ncbi:MAG TPA: TetR/AcrR family transcriptional regulator [Candidatus Tumulicola sp.]
MSPRAYQAGERRQLATEATRSKIIEAARAVLADPQSTGFSVDAIAERADVARMTVYYQFKSKGKLLEAVFDDFGARANMKDLAKAFRDSDARRGMQTLVEVFCHLWQSQATLLRKLNALSVLDPEVNAALAERGSWRREAITTLLGRVAVDSESGDLIDVLLVLTDFDAYNFLSSRHKHKKIVATLQGAVRTLLDARN